MNIEIIIPPLHRRWNRGILYLPRCLFVRPFVCRQLDFWNFLKKKTPTIGSIHFLPDIYPYGMSLLTPVHFRVPSLISTLWWPNIWPKMGFPELFEKAIGSIHFIPGIYPYGVSLLTLLHFRVSSLICGPLVAKCFAENGVSGIILKKLLAQFISYLAFTLMGWFSLLLYIFVFLAKIKPARIRFVLEKCWLIFNSSLVIVFSK